MPIWIRLAKIGNHNVTKYATITTNNATSINSDVGKKKQTKTKRRFRRSLSSDNITIRQQNQNYQSINDRIQIITGDGGDKELEAEGTIHIAVD